LLTEEYGSLIQPRAIIHIPVQSEPPILVLHNPTKVYHRIAGKSASHESVPPYLYLNITHLAS
jgi:hypothetical protein